MIKNAIELNVNDVVRLPDDIIIQNYDDNNTIVIAISEAKWMVLSGAHEVQIFGMIQKGTPISTLLNKFDEQSVSVVLSKIFARELDCSCKKEISVSDMANECMYIYLTQGCNLRCKHCYMFSGSKLNGELSIEQWKQVLRDFKECGGKVVNFTGGEPLLYVGFAELVEYSFSLGLIVSVLSNGMLWTDEIINRLKHCINDVQISIDGVDEISYNKVRIGGSFDKVVNNAIKIAKSGIHLTVATTFTFENLGDDIKSKYVALIGNLHKETNKNIDFRLSKKMLNGRDVNYSHEENELYYDKIKEIESFANPNGAEINFIEGHQAPVSNCGIGGITVASNGDVYYCNRTSEFENDGNIVDKPMKYFIRKGKKLNEATSVDNVIPCKECSLRYICGGGCRIDNFSIHSIDNQKNVTKTELNGCKQSILDNMVKSFNMYYKFK